MIDFTQTCDRCKTSRKLKKIEDRRQGGWSESKYGNTFYHLCRDCTTKTYNIEEATDDAPARKGDIVEVDVEKLDVSKLSVDKDN